MKLLKQCLIFCLLVCGCMKSENEPLKYGNTMSEFITNEIDEKTVELYQELSNKEYTSVSFSYHHGDAVKKVEFNHPEKLHEFFNLAEQSVLGLNLVMPGFTAEELEKLDQRVNITAVGADGKTSEWIIFLSDYSVIKIKQDTNEYLIALKDADELNQFFSFAYIEAEQEKSYDEYIWANQETADLFDTAKAFLLTDWPNSQVYKKDSLSENPDSAAEALMAVFTLGCTALPPAPSAELFTYIMKQYPSYREINAGLGTSTKEFHTLDGHEEIIFHLPREIPVSSIIMTGEQFRAAFRQLFDAESTFDESASWHYSPQWFVSYSYFKEVDVYAYYAYPSNKSDDYAGWVMDIIDQEVNNGILTVNAVAAYVDIRNDYQTDEVRCHLYDQSYALIDAAQSSHSTSSLTDLLNAYQENLLMLEIKLIQHEDKSYSLLSAEYLNQIESMAIINAKLPIINVFKASDKDWTPIPQFNLSGNTAREVNLQLYYAALTQENVKFKIVEDDAYAMITQVNIQNGEKIVKGYKYDKAANQLTDLEGGKIAFIYLDQFGIDTLRENAYHPFTDDKDD